MTDASVPEDDPRVATRASLLDEELEAGSDDPSAQARAILEDSEERTLARDTTRETSLERRASEDTIDLLDPLPDYPAGTR